LQECKARTLYAQTANFPERYLDILGQTSATSDVEDSIDGIYKDIMRRPERSAEANAFIRGVTTSMDILRRTKPGASRARRAGTEVIRRIPPNQRDSPLVELPAALPIDYYDPIWYNQQPDVLKRLIAIPCVAFPPLVNTIIQPAVVALSDAEFEQKFPKHIKKVLKRYKLPTETEGEDWDLADADDEDEDEENNDDGLKDVESDDMETGPGA
jgi:hypothetical protein